MRFTDRVDAGRRLALELRHLAGPDLVVLGLPRGGVPVAFEVARALGAPLDVIVVRKLGVPTHPELGMGAIGEDGVTIVNDEIVRAAGVGSAQFAQVEARERAELDRRMVRFRRVRPRLDLHGRTALVVDDGVATGSTARAACEVARLHGAARVVLAVPVASADFDPGVGLVDQFVCVQSPAGFGAVGAYYVDFSPTTDDEVVRMLESATRAADRAPAPPAGPARPSVAARPSELAARDEDVTVLVGSQCLCGRLTVPAGALGLVVFAHGGGSSRHSPRNRRVAAVLNGAGFGTLLFDLLSVEEARDRRMVDDVDLAARRVLGATAWLRSQPGLATLPIGYCGASTGAAAALRAAADSAVPIAAVVSRSGRPDLVGPKLANVRAPTLFVVGGRDPAVLGVNRDATEVLGARSKLAIIPGAGHLFEEAGTLDAAAEAARDWFERHLVPVHV